MQEPSITIQNLIKANLVLSASVHAESFNAKIKLNQVCVFKPNWDGMVANVHHTKELWYGDCIVQVWGKKKAQTWALVEEVMNAIDKNRKAPGNGLKQIKNAGMDEITAYSESKERSQVPPPFGTSILVKILWERVITV